MISEREFCTRCRHRDWHFHDHDAIFEYRAAIRDLVVRYKFEHRRRLAGLFARFVYEKLQKRFPRVPIVPVPSRRGWGLLDKGNHVERIVRILEREYGVLVIRILKRSGKIPQKTLNEEARRQNIRDTISLNLPFGKLRSTLSSSPEVILFDDIFTTGATADECARILAMAGCRIIHVVSIAMDLKQGT